MGTLRIEPGAAGWEARTLPLCYAAPLPVLLFNTIFDIPTLLRWLGVLIYPVTMFVQK